MRLVSEAALHEAQAELTTELGITVEGAAAPPGQEHWPARDGKAQSC